MELGGSHPYFWVQEWLAGSSCFTPQHLSRSMGCFRFPPGDPDNDWITGGKESATVGPKSSGLPRDPAYRGTTVLVIDRWQGVVLHIGSGKGTNKSLLWKRSEYYKMLCRVPEIGRFHITRHAMGGGKKPSDLELGISERNPGQVHW